MRDGEGLMRAGGGGEGLARSGGSGEAGRPTVPPGAAEAAGGGAAAGRRRFLRLAAYAAPAAVALDVALAARALAQSPVGQGGTLEWPDDEEYGGPFPIP